MRAKYASLMMGYHASADLLDEGDDKGGKKDSIRGRIHEVPPVKEPIHSPSSLVSASLA